MRLRGRHPSAQRGYESHSFTVEPQLVPFGQHQLLCPRAQGEYPATQPDPVEPAGVTSAVVGVARRYESAADRRAEGVIGGSFIRRSFLNLKGRIGWVSSVQAWGPKGAGFNRPGREPWGQRPGVTSAPSRACALDY